MKPVIFVLEILAPDSADEVLASFKSAQPLMSLQRGDAIDTAHWGAAEPNGDPLRVVLVKHDIAETESITHTVSVHTERVAGAAELLSDTRQQWTSAVARIRDRARGIVDEAPELGRKGVGKIEQQIPRLKALASEKIGPLAKQTIQDDKAMAQTFSMLYEFLPTTLRLMIQEEAFVEFCLRNRKLLCDSREQDESPAGSVEAVRAEEVGRPASAVFG
jgi:hypothetical protein